MSENKEEEQKQMLAQMKSALRKVLDDKAYERMMNVLLINTKLFAMGSQKILMAYQKLGRTLTERDVLMILKSLKETPNTGGITIKRK